MICPLDDEPCEAPDHRWECYVACVKVVRQRVVKRLAGELLEDQ